MHLLLPMNDYYYSPFITPNEEDTKNLIEEIIRSRIRRKDYVEIVRFNDFDPWILWLSSQDTWYK